MKYVVTGAANKNGLGFMIVDELKKIHGKNMEEVEIISVCEPGAIDESDSDDTYYCDLSDMNDVLGTFSDISDENPEIYCLINCAGANKMDWFEDVNLWEYDNVMRVNCAAPIFAVQQLLPSLSKTKGTVLNIISMGAHKAFRTSLSYNISKAALKMANAQLARELTPKFGITVFGISPNELDGTGMTLDNFPEICRIRGWTPEQAEEYRVKSSGQSAEKTDPRTLAKFIAFLLHEKENHKHLTGVDLYYGD